MNLRSTGHSQTGNHIAGLVTLVLYRTRALGRVHGNECLARAFDKAVRRKPLAFAADAVGLWELDVGRRGMLQR